MSVTKFPPFILMASLLSAGVPSSQTPASKEEIAAFEQRVRTDVWSGPGDPPAWAYRYLKLMDDYSDKISKQAYCLKTRTLMNPSPKPSCVLGGIRIGVSSEYPRNGEKLEVQLRLSILFHGDRAPKQEDKVELMYELSASDGVIVGTLPELPKYNFRDHDSVVITLPVEVISEDFQLLKLNVCAYVNGVLMDWNWDAVELNFRVPGYEKRGRSERREINELLKQAAKGRAIAIFDEDGHLVKE